MSERSQPRPRTAAELMTDLMRDPAHVAREAESLTRSGERWRAYRRAAQPILTQLSKAGYDVESIGDLRAYKGYQAAIPVLLEWLPRVSDRSVKIDLIRTLGTKLARPQAARPLIGEFLSLSPTSDPPSPDTLRWAIGDALSVVADDSVFDELAGIAIDRRHGDQRGLVVVALGNMHDPRAVQVLVPLLEDPEVAGYAVMALGKLKASEAAPRIESFLNDPSPWVRREARKALSGMGH
jgi:HEAT repeat protein